MLKTAKQKIKSFKKELNLSKREFIKNKISNYKNITKTTWNLINNEVGKQNITDIQSVSSNGKLVTAPEEICNSFNNYYVLNK